jgi:hypothetical protein
VSFAVTFEFVSLNKASHDILLVVQQLVGVARASLVGLVTILNRANLSLELASSTVITLQLRHLVIRLRLILLTVGLYSTSNYWFLYDHWRRYNFGRHHHFGLSIFLLNFRLKFRLLPLLFLH